MPQSQWLQSLSVLGLRFWLALSLLGLGFWGGSSLMMRYLLHRPDPTIWDFQVEDIRKKSSE